MIPHNKILTRTLLNRLKYKKSNKLNDYYVRKLFDNKYGFCFNRIKFHCKGWIDVESCTYINEYKTCEIELSSRLRTVKELRDWEKFLWHDQ